MESPPEKPKMSREVSELVPLHPNMVLSEDPFSNQSYDPNYQSEFQTAPSSPPNKGSTAELSFPLLPKLLQQPKLNVSNGTINPFFVCLLHTYFIW